MSQQPQLRAQTGITVGTRTSGHIPGWRQFLSAAQRFGNRIWSLLAPSEGTDTEADAEESGSLRLALSAESSNTTYPSLASGYGPDYTGQDEIESIIEQGESLMNEDVNSSTVRISNPVSDYEDDVLVSSIISSASWSQTVERSASAPLTNERLECLVTLQHWLINVQRSEYTSSDMVVPVEFSSFLSRQCDIKCIKGASWFFSAGSDKTLIITGDDVTKILYDTDMLEIDEDEVNITKVILKDNPQPMTLSLNFKIEWVKTQVVTRPLSAKIRGGSCKEPGTCELLLRANNSSSTEAIYLIATAGHVFMENHEMIALDSGRVPVHDQQQMLYQVCQRYQPTTLFGQHPASALNVSLQMRPFICYRTHRDDRNEFMSDITCFPLNTRNGSELSNIAGKRQKCKSFNYVVEISQQSHIDNDMLELDKPLYQRRNPPIVLARGRRGHVVEMRGSPAHSQLGLNLAFVLEHGPDFSESDSGTIIYTERRAEDGVTIVRDAIGMLKGVRPLTGIRYYNRPAIYEATLLYPSLTRVCQLGHLADMRTC